MNFLDEHSVRRALSPLLGNEDTPISLLTHAQPLTFNPYVFAERWIDTYGNTYLIDTEYIVRTVDSAPRRHYPTWSSREEERSGIQKLRTHAEKIISKIIPHFEKIKPNLHPFESNRTKSLYTFRWEKSGCFTDDERIPSFSLTLGTSGEIIRMENALANLPPLRFVSTQQLNRTNKLFTAIKLMEKQTEAGTAR